MKIKRAFALVTALLATASVAAACGDDGNSSAGSAKADRVIEVAMTDMAYSPTTFKVAKGETVTFRFRNNGKVMHEAVIGDTKYQMDHGASMSSSTMAMGGATTDDPGMGHGGMGADNIATVEPGKTGDMTYRFDESGTLLIGCHQPGPYGAGMKATVNAS